MKVEEIRAEYLTSITWRRSKLSELAEIIRGVTYKKDQASDRPEAGKLPILRATNIQDGDLVLDRDLVYVPKELITKSQTLRAGDIVVATSSGSKHLVGKTALGSRGVERLLRGILRGNSPILRH